MNPRWLHFAACAIAFAAALAAGRAGMAWNRPTPAPPPLPVVEKQSLPLGIILQHAVWTEAERAEMGRAVRHEPDAVAREIARLAQAESADAWRRLFAMTDELTADDVCRLVGRCADSPALEETLPAALAAWPEMIRRLSPERVLRPFERYVRSQVATQGAATLANQMADLPRALQHAVNTFFNSWWTTDRTAAKEWLRSLPPCPTRSTALTVFRSQVGSLPADEAMREIDAWAPTVERPDWWRAWGSGEERQSSDGITLADVRRRLGGMTLEELPVECLEGVGRQEPRSVEDIRAGARELPEAHALAFARGVGWRRGFDEKQAVAAAEAFRQWPEAPLRRAALEGVGESLFTISARVNLPQWLSAWPAGPERDAVVRGLMSSPRFAVTGGEGLELTALVSDPAERRALSRRAVLSLRLEKDPVAAARESVEQSNLPEAEKAALLRSLP